MPDESAEAGAEAGGNGEGMPDEGAAGAERTGKDAVSASAGTETDLRETDEREIAEEEEAERDGPKEDEPVFGRGIESEKSLSEDVVLALKNGDTESLIGVALGEEFDYEVYKGIGRDMEGRDTYRPKEIVFDWRLKYYFEGEGHCFSGFSIANGENRFWGWNLEKILPRCLRMRSANRMSVKN